MSTRVEAYIISKADVGVQSNVASAAVDTVLLASNVKRLGATVENDSTSALNLLLSPAVSSATVRTRQLAPGTYYELPFGYTGVVKGFWTTANGFARITEFT